MKLLTRKQLIDIWSKQSFEQLNSFCCPKCRDLLLEYPTHFFCLNEECSQEYILKHEVIYEK